MTSPSDQIRIVCGEWGSEEAARWSRPFVASEEDLGELSRLEAQGRLDVVTERGRVRIAGREYCGRIRLPSGASIEIAPKVPTLQLLEWLVFTGLMPELEEWLDDPTFSPNGTVVDALLVMFVCELERLTRFHWRPGYVHVRKDTARFRGRLDVPRFARTASMLPTLPCVFRQRTMDTPANRILALALDATCRLVDRGSWSDTDLRRLDRLVRQWSDIDRSVVELRTAISHAVALPPVGYRSALRIARLMLLGVVLDEANGEGGDRFLIELSRVWEFGLRRMLAEWATKVGEKAAAADARTRPWDDAVGEDANRWLTVDAMLHGTHPIVFDAKYKRGYGNEAREDRFQMAAYALRFAAAAAVLVYPTANGALNQRLLLRTTLPVASEIHSVELPMSAGPRVCSEAAASLFQTLLDQCFP